MVNGYVLKVSADEGEAFILSLAGSTSPVALDSIATWIEVRLMANAG